MTRQEPCSSDRRHELYMEALVAPMPWFKLDSDFLNDPKVRRLGFVGGWEYIGMYCGLIAHLAAEDSHMYDVSDDYGWAVLQAHMSPMGHQVPIDGLMAFVKTLAELGLIDAEMLGESGKVASNRLMREAENYAEKTARNKLQGELMRSGKEAKSKS